MKKKKTKGVCSNCGQVKYLTVINALCFDCAERGWNDFKVARDEGRI